MTETVKKPKQKSEIQDEVKESSDLSNIWLSGGDYSPISHTFFKHPNMTLGEEDDGAEDQNNASAENGKKQAKYTVKGKVDHQNLRSNQVRKNVTKH